MIEALHTNPTQLIGLLAFACAAIACARTALARRERPWWWLCAACSGFVLEVAVGLRHRTHDLVDALLQAEGSYASRGPVQIGLLAVALVLSAGTLAWLIRARGADANVKAATVGCAAALWLFLIEAISLHGVDAVMYAHIGPVMLIGWAWAATALLVLWAALRAATIRRESAPARRR
jgi:hypothetical protein